MILPVSANLPKGNGIVYRSARGMGDDNDPGYDDYNDPTVDTPTSSLYPIAAGPPVSTSSGGTTTNIYPVTTTGGSSSSSGSSNSLINALATGGIQIGKTLAAEAAAPGTQLLYNAQGQLVSSTSIPTTALTSAATSLTSMMPVLLIIAGLFFVMQAGKH